MNFEEIKENYIEQYKQNDCNYIVLKMEDLMKSILDEGQWNALQLMLHNYNAYRDMHDKPINKYFVVNRDDFPKFKTADEFFKALHNAHDKL